MIKFFRTIRLHLIAENKMGKYFKYAIGEILLVVVGILIAVQINDWNEGRKATSNEQDILISLRSDLVENQKELNGILGILQESSEVGDKIIATLKNEPEEPDSLSAWVDLFNRNPIFNNANTTYLMLESSSEALISNDSLRILVTMMYEKEFKNVHRREEVNLLTYYPRYQQELNTWFKVGPNHSLNRYEVEVSVNTPIDYTLLRQGHSFNNAIVELSNFKKLRIHWLKESIENLSELISIIDKEIERTK